MEGERGAKLIPGNTSMEGEGKKHDQEAGSKRGGGDVRENASKLRGCASFTHRFPLKLGERADLWLQVVATIQGHFASGGGSSLETVLVMGGEDRNSNSRAAPGMRSKYSN